MPFGSAFMRAGIYTLGGETWDCKRQGLYRFMVSGEQFIRNRIVVDDPIDVYALISAICWNHVHGSGDEGYDNQTLSNMGRYQRWRLRCGYIVDLVLWLLPQLGLSGRKINVYTREPRNGHDDGHVVLDTAHGMWDFTNGCYWRDAGGKHLSTTAIIRHIANGGPMPERVFLDGDSRRADAEIADMPAGPAFDLGLYNELVVLPDFEAWMRRIFQAYQVTG